MRRPTRFSNFLYGNLSHLSISGRQLFHVEEIVLAGPRVVRRVHSAVWHQFMVDSFLWRGWHRYVSPTAHPPLISVQVHVKVTIVNLEVIFEG